MKNSLRQLGSRALSTVPPIRRARAQRDLARRMLRRTRRQLERIRRTSDSLAHERLELREQNRTYRLEINRLWQPHVTLNNDIERLRVGVPWRTPATDNVPLRTLAYAPYGHNNPVLPLLYIRCPEYGFLPKPMARATSAAGLDPGSVFHLHWARFAPLAGASEAENLAAAREWSRKTTDVVKALSESGVTVGWSIHEPLPHDCMFPDIELEVRREMAEVADFIHVLHPGTIDAVRGFYEIDRTKVHVLEHPLYTGVYPDHVTRKSARASLRLEDDEFVVLVFGSIRPYKGIDGLLASVRELHNRHPNKKLRTLIVGPPHRDLDTSSMRLRARSTPGVSLSVGAVRPAHVQYYFRAADLVVLPYLEFLNSGVLMLALTFDCPVLVAENPVSITAKSSGLVRVYSQDREGALTEELERALLAPDDLPSGPLDAAFANVHDPRNIADRLGAFISSVAGEPGPVSGVSASGERWRAIRKRALELIDLAHSAPLPPRVPVSTAGRVFVVGCARSGTTWVRDIFGQHPLVITGHESHIYPDVYQPLISIAGLPDAWTRVLARFESRRSGTVGLVHWLGEEGVERLLVRAMASPPEPRSLMAEHLVVEIYDAILANRAATGENVLVDKTPIHIHYAREIVRHFPQARVVEVVRDGRDVCVSMEKLGAGWVPRTFEGRIARWADSIEAGIALRADPAIAPRIHTVRYEDLLADTVGEISRLLEFAGLPATRGEIDRIAAATAFSSYPETGEGLHKRKGVAGDWVNHFTEREEALFKQLAGGLLVQAGYSVVCPS